MGSMLRQLRDRKEAKWFNRAVDPIADGVPRYLEIIREPMDFRTMQQKLDDGQYAGDRDRFARDVRLVFSNALLFNVDADSPVRQSALTLSNFFENKWTDHKPSEPPSKNKKRKKNDEPKRPPTPPDSEDDDSSDDSESSSDDDEPIAVKKKKKKKKKKNQAPAAPSSGKKVNPKKKRGRPPAKHKKLPTFEKSTASKIVLQVVAQPEAYHFNEPVDAVALGIPDYHKIIKKPMDFSTIRENIKAQKYATYEALVQDIRLVFANAMTFNSDPGNAVHRDAVALSTIFEAKFKAALGVDPPKFVLASSARNYRDDDSDDSDDDQTRQKHRKKATKKPTTTTKKKDQKVPTTTTNGASSKPKQKHDDAQRKRKKDMSLQEKLKAVLEGVGSGPEAYFFMQPVDPIALNIPDYPEIVREPMDLGTMTWKLQTYDLAGFQRDAELISSNATLYNSNENHDVHKAALKLRSAFQRRLAEYFDPGELEKKRPRPAVKRKGRTLAAKLEALTAELFALESSYFFRVPVDPVAMGCPDYPEIIKSPMDLGTLRSKIPTYDTPAAYAKDANLIFYNAKTYNPDPRHDVHVMANDLESHFDSLYTDMFPNGIDEPEEEEPPAKPVVQREKEEAPPQEEEEEEDEDDEKKDFHPTMEKLLGFVQRQPHADIFAVPVDPITQNAPDYLTIVKTPMDFGTIRKKLRSYETIGAFIADVRQVYKNARKYNKSPTHFVHHVAAESSRAFEKELKSLGLAEDSKVTDEDRMRQLLDALSAKKDLVYFFLEPVDPVALGLHDYFDVVKEPMDLGTIRTKLSSYDDLDNFANDVRLVFTNAMLYNKDPKLAVYDAASRLLQLFDTKFSALRKKHHGKKAAKVPPPQQQRPPLAEDADEVAPPQKPPIAAQKKPVVEAKEVPPSEEEQPLSSKRRRVIEDLYDDEEDDDVEAPVDNDEEYVAPSSSSSHPAAVVKAPEKKKAPPPKPAGAPPPPAKGPQLAKLPMRISRVSEKPEPLAKPKAPERPPPVDFFTAFRPKDDGIAPVEIFIPEPRDDLDKAIARGDFSHWDLSNVDTSDDVDLLAPDENAPEEHKHLWATGYQLALDKRKKDALEEEKKLKRIADKEELDRRYYFFPFFFCDTSPGESKRSSPRKSSAGPTKRPKRPSASRTSASPSSTPTRSVPRNGKRSARNEPASPRPLTSIEAVSRFRTFFRPTVRPPSRTSYQSFLPSSRWRKRLRRPRITSCFFGCVTFFCFFSFFLPSFQLLLHGGLRPFLVPNT